MERLPPRAQRMADRAVHLVVAGPDHVEEVLVEAEQQVQAVLFDAAVRPAAGRALPSETPAHLIDRDVVPVAQGGIGGQPVDGRERRGPAAQHRDLRLRRSQGQTPEAERVRKVSAAA